MHTHNGFCTDSLLTLNIILNGDSSLSEQRYLALHTTVPKYILKTNRF